MKKLILTLIAATFFLCSCNQFKVKLNLENADNQTIYLCKDVDGQSVCIDTAVFSGKRAVMKADYEDPQTLYIIKYNTDDNCGVFSFFTENQKTTISGDFNDMPHWTVKGCPTMNILNEYHQQSLVQFENPIMALYGEMNEANENGDAQRILEIDAQLDTLIEAYRNNEIEFIRSQSGSYLGHYMLYLVREEMGLETVMALYEGFTTESQYSQKVKEYIENEQNIMKRTLIAYFSATGTTKAAAQRLAEEFDADLFEIVPEQLYTAADLNWRDKKSRSTIEMQDKTSRPAIKSLCENIDQYDTVWIGFPVWWYTAPTIINTFIEAHDLNGKTINVFATSGGSGVEGSYNDLKNAYPQYTWGESRLMN